MADTSLRASGIYAIRNTVNGKCYVGSACDFQRREAEHRKLLRGGRHHSRKLQSAWDKYGEKAFEWVVIEIARDPETLLEKEQDWLDVMRPHERGYNILPRAGSRLGSKRTPEQISRVSASLTGRKQSPEHIANRVAKNTGQKRTPETRLKLHAALAKARLTNPGSLGRVLSEETKQKIRAKALGRKPTEAARAKMSSSHTGRKQSQEHIQNAIRGRREAVAAKGQT